MKRIDIGINERPAPGFDVYTDILIPKNMPTDGPFVQCSLEDMPFADKEFDYARCNHVIEHVVDPNKACSELIRIAKGGTITFPSAQLELNRGSDDHKWIVFIDYGRLVFFKKKYPNYNGLPNEPLNPEVIFNWGTSFPWIVIE